MQSSPEKFFRFRAGVPAFEEDQEFRLLAEPDWQPFAVLESVRADGPRFVCVEIQALISGYEVHLCEEDRGLVGIAVGQTPLPGGGLRLLAVVTELEDGTLAANLAAPLVLNLETGEGVQTIQPGVRYSPFTIIRAGEEKQRCS